MLFGVTNKITIIIIIFCILLLLLSYYLSYNFIIILLATKCYYGVIKIELNILSNDSKCNLASP